MKTLFYVLDPMCSWCYAFSPTFEKLKKSLPKDIYLTYIMGGLAPHSSEEMSKDMQVMLQNIWKQINTQVGIKFNFDFWSNCKPRRSTYLACQACVAAREQNKEYEMIQAIQYEYYLNASNPSDKETLGNAAKKIVLDLDKFLNDLESKEIIEKFQDDLLKRRKLEIQGFPSLVLQKDDQPFPLRVEYNNHEKILKQINTLV